MKAHILLTFFRKPVQVSNFYRDFFVENFIVNIVFYMQKIIRIQIKKKNAKNHDSIFLKTNSDDKKLEITFFIGTFIVNISFSI